MASSNAALAHYLDGPVYCDANGNGLIDSADFNISGAIVRADEASLGSFRGESMPPNGYYNVFGSMTLVAFNDVQSTGSTVAVNYQVRNNGDALQGVTLLATPIGHNIDLGNLAANESRSISRDATINANTTITAAVTGTLSDGQICQATGTTTVTTVAPGGSNGGRKPCKKGDKKGVRNKPTI